MSRNFLIPPRPGEKKEKFIVVVVVVVRRRWSSFSSFVRSIVRSYIRSFVRTFHFMFEKRIGAEKIFGPLTPP